MSALLGVAAAQEAGEGRKPSESDATTSDPGASSDFVAADPSTLSEDALRTTSAEYLSSMRAIQTEVRALFASAKENKDVVKTLCLEDKLTGMGAAVETASDRREALLEALESGALEQAQHEFTLIGALAERAHELAAEGGQCIGEETSFSEDDDSTLELTIEGALPDVNADVIAFAPVLVIPPSVKSPVD